LVLLLSRIRPGSFWPRVLRLASSDSGRNPKRPGTREEDLCLGGDPCTPDSDGCGDDISLVAVFFFFLDVYIIYISLSSGAADGEVE